MPAKLLAAILSLSCLLPLTVLPDEEGNSTAGPVQVLSGRIDADEVVIYRLPAMAKGRRLSIRVDGLSGNLDPAVGLIASGVDASFLEDAYEDVGEVARSQGVDPYKALETLRAQYFLAFDDDGGGGLSAALDYVIPDDADYGLLVTAAQKMLSGDSFGDYRLWVGLDTPGVIDGSAVAQGPQFVLRDLEATPPGVGVDEISGALDRRKPSTFVLLQNIKAGDTLYAYLETTTGDLRPSLLLNNFARKAIRSSNLDGSAPRASLQYQFPAAGENYELKISACCDSVGQYRLLLGFNEPEVLMGRAEVDGRPVIRWPIAINIGLQLEQIIEVNQRKEIFSAVAKLQMEWQDPALAFNPETCQCDSRTLHDLALDQFITAAEGSWPAISFRNQQGKRWSQNRSATVFANGRVIYSERFTTNFQVDFDFRQFPFDTQEFLIHIDAQSPEELFVFEDLPGFSGISEGHGEDEFILTTFDTRIHSIVSSSGESFSGFTFRFEAPRHLSYYVFRIFVPISLLIMVSWFTFFLRDYKHRIEVTSANLLVYIAFSFSIAGNYPRLGYLTFLDAVMAVMFVMSALIIVYNVSMKRLELTGSSGLVNRIDNIMDWTVPLMFLAWLGIMLLVFF